MLFNKVFIPFLFAVCLLGCKNGQPVVEQTFVDSILNVGMPDAVNRNEQDVAFWGARYNRASPTLSNDSKYAAALFARFNIKGDINDIIKSDSILEQLVAAYNGKEPSVYMSLVSHSISRHRFRQADSLLQLAKQPALKKYDEAATTFDVAFETGNYQLAGSMLNLIKGENYGYYFRKAKMDHYNGSLDSAVAHMLHATKLAEVASLKQAALSNAADLYLHKEEPGKAYQLFKESLRMNSGDYHSLMGIGWIALVVDKKDSLAEKVFSFVKGRTAQPDPVYKLMSVAEFRKDTGAERKYADEFTRKVTDRVYGNMYNKYLVHVYTDIVNKPAKALEIATREMSNRSTPQTNAWLTWALFLNGKKEQAAEVYAKNVSGKPLEALELYWMGKYMAGIQKQYNAREFFKAADKNRLDLFPAIVEDIDRQLKQ
jgi:hypothetical protein